MADHHKHEELEKQIQRLERELVQGRLKLAEIEREHLEYASIIANVPLFIMIVDEDRRVQKVSQAVLQTLGRTEEEILGMRGGEALRCVHHLDDPQGCGFGPACETCKIRSIVQDTLSNAKSHHRVEASLSIKGDALAERIFRVSTTPIQQEGVNKAHVFVEDITEQKHAEIRLHLRERQQAAISEIGQMALARANLSGLLDKAIELLHEAMDIDLSNILKLQPIDECFLLKAGRGWHDGLVGKAMVSAGKNSQAGFALLSSQPVIVRDLQKESRFTGAPLLIDHGVVSGISVIIGHIDKPYGVLGVHSKKYREFSGRDVEFVQSMADILANAIERKKIEQSLKESEQRYRLVFHQAPIGVLHIDAHAKVVDINENYTRMIGVTREQAIGVDILNSATDPNVIRAIKDALDGKTGYFAGELHSSISGKTIACKVIGQGIRDGNNALIGGVAIVEDLTEQKKMQESLRRSEFYLKQAQSVAGVGSWHLDIANDVLTWSDQTYVIFGLKRRMPLNISDFLNCIHPEDKQKVESAWRAAIKGAPYDIEHRTIANDEIRWVHEKAQITFDKDGSPLEGIGTVHDITEIKRVEKALRKSEEKFRAIFDQAAVGVCLSSTPAGSILQVNRKYCAIVGFSEDDLKKITFQEITHPDDLQAYLDKMMQLKEGKINHFSMEKRYVHQNGSIIWVNLTVSPMRPLGEHPAQHISVIEDITERKMMEAEMKILGGLLPICSSCKKIRDDQGYWNQLESYIIKHSQAEFSHSICPDCVKKLYPEMDLIRGPSAT